MEDSFIDSLSDYEQVRSVMCGSGDSGSDLFASPPLETKEANSASSSLDTTSLDKSGHGTTNEEFEEISTVLEQEVVMRKAWRLASFASCIPGQDIVQVLGTVEDIEIRVAVTWTPLSGGQQLMVSVVTDETSSSKLRVLSSLSFELSCDLGKEHFALKTPGYSDICQYLPIGSKDNIMELLTKAGQTDLVFKLSVYRSNIAIGAEEFAESEENRLQLDDSQADDLKSRLMASLEQLKDMDYIMDTVIENPLTLALFLITLVTPVVLFMLFSILSFGTVGQVEYNQAALKSQLDNVLQNSFPGVTRSDLEKLMTKIEDLEAVIAERAIIAQDQMRYSSKFVDLSEGVKTCIVEQERLRFEMEQMQKKMDQISVDSSKFLGKVNFDFNSMRSVVSNLEKEFKARGNFLKGWYERFQKFTCSYLPKWAQVYDCLDMSVFDYDTDVAEIAHEKVIPPKKSSPN